jgi:preprotein translocase subunit YajC
MGKMLVMFQAAEAQPGGGMSFWIMMILIFVVMYFFMIRPQQKRQKELMKFRQSLEKGNKVITAGGIYGTVKSVEENTVMLEVDHNVAIRVDKSSLMRDPSDIVR